MPREIEIKVRVSDTVAFVDFLNAQAEFTGEQHQVDEYFTPPDRDFTAVRPVNEWLRLRTSEQRREHLRSGSALGDHSSEVKETLQSSINYKLWRRDPVDGKSLYGDESESSIGDMKAMRDILSALNFRSLCTVDKVRRTWRYQIPNSKKRLALGVIPDRLSDGASEKQDRESSLSDPGTSMSSRVADSSTGSPIPLRSCELRRDKLSVFASGSGSRMTKQETYEIALDREKTLGDFVEVELIGETTEAVSIVRDRMLRFLKDHGINNPNADQVGYPYLLLFGNPKMTN